MVWHFCGIYYFTGLEHRFNIMDEKLPLKFAKLKNPMRILRTFFEHFMKISTHKIACYTVNFFLLHTLIEYKDVVSGV